MMNVLIAGGTGFIGTHLTNKLSAQNNKIFILTRNPKMYRNSSNVTYIDHQIQLNHLPQLDVVINLAGESLFGYWTKNHSIFLNSKFFIAYL